MQQDPAYVVAANHVRRLISDGTYKPGEPLPTAVQLTTELHTSRDSVLKAYRLLQDEGLILSSTSRGTWVREHVVFATDATAFERADRPDAGGDAFTEAVRAAGRVPSTQFSMHIAPCPEEVAQRLGVKPDELVCIRSVTQKVDGIPWSQQTSYYAMDIAQKCGLTSTTNIPEGTIRRMAKRGHEEVASYDEETTRPPTPSEQRHLRMPPGTPMEVWCRTAATKLRVTRVTVTYLPGDRNKLIHQQGEAAGLSVIHAVRAAGGAA